MNPTNTIFVVACTIFPTVECVDVEPDFPCFVIQGRLTLFSATKLDEATILQVQTAIRLSIETGNLEDSDNRFLGVSFKDFDDPQSDDSTNEGNDDSDNNGTQIPTGTENPQDPDDSSVSPSEDSNGGLEPWAISVISIGGVVVVVMAYLCLRRPNNNNRQKLDEDDGDDSSGSQKGGYKDEVDRTSPAELVPIMPVDYSPARESINEHEERAIEQQQEEEEDEEEQGEEEPESEGSYDDPENSRSTDPERSRSTVRDSHTELHDEDMTERDLEDSGDVSTAIEDESYETNPSFDGPRSHEPMYDNENTQNENYISHMSLNVDKSNESNSLSAVSLSESDDVRGRQPAEHQSVGIVSEGGSSAYSSYEEVVEEEYEIEYAEGSDQQGGDHWDDEAVDDHAETSLPFLAHNAQQGQTPTSFDLMRNKWESR
jgi:hypothetical protein